MARFLVHSVCLVGESMQVVQVSEFGAPVGPCIKKSTE